MKIVTIQRRRRRCNSDSPAHKRWASASDWTAPSACTRLCAGLSCSQSAGSACWDRSPGFRFSTVETNTKDGDIRGDSWLCGRRRRRNSQEKCCHLLQAAVHSVRATDVEAEQDGVRVAVAQWPHVVIVRGTLRRQNVEENYRNVLEGLTLWQERSTNTLFSCSSPQISDSVHSGMFCRNSEDNLIKFKMCIRFALAIFMHSQKTMFQQEQKRKTP